VLAMTVAAACVLLPQAVQVLVPLWGRQIPYTMMKFGGFPVQSPL